MIPCNQFTNRIAIHVSLVCYGIDEKQEVPPSLIAVFLWASLSRDNELHHNDLVKYTGEDMPNEFINKKTKNSLVKQIQQYECTYQVQF